MDHRQRGEGDAGRGRMVVTGTRALGVVRRLSAIREPLTPVACAVYAANVAVGTASLRRHRLPRRVHSRLYILTCATTALAAACSLPGHRPRGAAMACALVPLAALPRLGAHARRRPRRHVLIAVSAAPFYLAALALWAGRFRNRQEM